MWRGATRTTVVALLTPRLPGAFHPRMLLYHSTIFHYRPVCRDRRQRATPNVRNLVRATNERPTAISFPDHFDPRREMRALRFLRPSRLYICTTPLHLYRVVSYVRIVWGGVRSCISSSPSEPYGVRGNRPLTYASAVMSLATLLLVVVVYIEVRRVQGRSMSTNLLLVVSDLTDPCNLTEAARCLPAHCVNCRCPIGSAS